jgi:hypothetical protein
LLICSCASLGTLVFMRSGEAIPRLEQCFFLV